MTRIKKDDQEIAKSVVESMVQKEQPVNIEEMPLNSLGDYIRYNAEARKINKKLKVLRYPIKQCPVELHPKETIVFGRNDQPSNYLPVYLSNDLIEFEMKLYPGKTYELPRVVVDYLSKKGVPEWKWFTNHDGSTETRISQYKPRFALRTIYKD